MPGTRAISRIAHKAYVVAGAGLIALATSSCGTATTATERAQAGTPETGLVQAEAATTHFDQLWYLTAMMRHRLSRDIKAHKIQYCLSRMVFCTSLMILMEY